MVPKTPTLGQGFAKLQDFFTKAYNYWQVGNRQTTGNNYTNANVTPVVNYKTKTIEAIANLATRIISNCATTARVNKTIMEESQTN